MIEAMLWLFTAWMVMEGANVVLRRLRARLDRLSREEDERHEAAMRSIADDPRLTPKEALLRAEGILRRAKDRADAALQTLADLGQEWDAAPSLTPRDREPPAFRVTLDPVEAAREFDEATDAMLRRAWPGPVPPPEGAGLCDTCAMGLFPRCLGVNVACPRAIPDAGLCGLARREALRDPASCEGTDHDPGKPWRAE